jgi:hypothetical protein
MLGKITFGVAVGDIDEQGCDAIALKFSGTLSEEETFLLKEIGTKRFKKHLPHLGAGRGYEADSSNAVKAVVLVNVPGNGLFDYPDARSFGELALSSLKETGHGTERLALLGAVDAFGLDETESFELEVCGLLDALSKPEIAPTQLNSVTFVCKDLNAAKRLQKNLDSLFPDDRTLSLTRRTFVTNLDHRMSVLFKSKAKASQNKPLIFVIMPFNTEMNDLYHYPIQQAAHAARMLCERTDTADFDGYDGYIWKRAKSRIEVADIVVADLSAQNPNVCLELGYALGKGRQTILVVKKGKKPPIDMQSEACIMYDGMTDLQEKLTERLDALVLDRKAEGLTSK